MDNLSIARLFANIGDLLELKGENTFKIRAYRAAADIIGHASEPFAELNTEELLAIPGIGKAIAEKIREIAETGRLTFHQKLLGEFPTTILDLLHLQGVGPKTVALLYQGLGLGSIDELEIAATEGRLSSLPGHGPKKEQLILTAVARHRQGEGRHLRRTAT